MTRLGIERPQLSPEIEAELVRRAGLEEARHSIEPAVAALSANTGDAITLRIVDELSYPEG